MFVIMDIGCMECGEDSQLIGVYHRRDAAMEELREQAKKVNQLLRADQESFTYFSSGEHQVRVFSSIEEA